MAALVDEQKEKLQHTEADRGAVLPGLYRERLVQELLIEVLLDVVHQNDRFALLVKLRATCPAHHLQNICTDTQQVKVSMTTKATGHIRLETESLRRWCSR